MPGYNPIHDGLDAALKRMGGKKDAWKKYKKEQERQSAWRALDGTGVREAEAEERGYHGCGRVSWNPKDHDEYFALSRRGNYFIRKDPNRTTKDHIDDLLATATSGFRGPGRNFGGAGMQQNQPQFGGPAMGGQQFQQQHQQAWQGNSMMNLQGFQAKNMTVPQQHFQPVPMQNLVQNSQHPPPQARHTEQVMFAPESPGSLQGSQRMSQAAIAQQTPRQQSQLDLPAQVAPLSIPTTPMGLGSSQMNFSGEPPLVGSQHTSSLYVQSLQAVQMQEGWPSRAPRFSNNGTQNAAPMMGSQRAGSVRIQQQTRSRPQRVPSSMSPLNHNFQTMPPIPQIVIQGASATTPVVQSTTQSSRTVQTHVMPGAQAPASAMDSMASLNSTTTQHYQLGNMQRSVIEGLAPPGPHNWASPSGFARRE